MELTAFVNHAFGKIFNMIHRIFWVRFLRDTTRSLLLNLKVDAQSTAPDKVSVVALVKEASDIGTKA